MPINKGVTSEIMKVFLSILNINSTINPDAVAKNRCRRWAGNKLLVTVGLIFINTYNVKYETFDVATWCLISEVKNLARLIMLVNFASRNYRKQQN